ncbi:MAG: ABC transporter substrate-binding protein [Oscillospiraceae bacterium]
MNKFFKNAAAITLAAAMAIPFAGCSNSGSSSDGATMVIGGIGPVTGPAAIYGTNVKNGAQIAVNEINAAGGVNGIKLVLEFQDDEHDAEKAVNAYNSLKDKGMKALVGTVTSAPCVAVVEETHNDNMFQITPSGSAVDCIKYDNAFRVCFTDPSQGVTAAQYIGQQKLATKVAVIYDSSDVYSAGIYEGFAGEAANQGIEIVTTQAFTADSATDFSVQIQKVAESGAELLFLPIYYQQAALIMQQAQGTLDVTIFGGDGLDGVIDQLGDDVAIAQDVLVMTPFAASSTDEKSVKFTEAYKELTGGEIPIQFAADAYDAVYAIKAAMEKAGIKDANISVSDLGDALKKAMTEITLDGITGSTTWDAAGEPTKAPKVMRIVVTDGVGSYVAA